MIKVYKFRNGSELISECDDFGKDVKVVDWELILPDGKTFTGVTNFGNEIKSDVYEIDWFNMRPISKTHYLYLSKILMRWWKIFGKKKRKNN